MKTILLINMVVSIPLLIILISLIYKSLTLSKIDVKSTEKAFRDLNEELFLLTVRCQKYEEVIDNITEENNKMKNYLNMNS